MAHRASELIQFMRDHRMRSVRLVGNVCETRFLQPDVATGAAIDHPEFGQPYLLDAALKMPLQRVRIAAIADHPEIAVLVMPPLAEEILRWSNRQRDEENQAYHAESSHAIAEQLLPERRKYLFHDRRTLMNLATAR